MKRVMIVALTVFTISEFAMADFSDWCRALGVAGLTLPAECVDLVICVRPNSGEPIVCTVRPSPTPSPSVSPHPSPSPTPSTRPTPTPTPSPSISPRPSPSPSTGPGGGTGGGDGGGTSLCPQGTWLLAFRGIRNGHLENAKLYNYYDKIVWDTRDGAIYTCAVADSGNIYIIKYLYKDPQLPNLVNTSIPDTTAYFCKEFTWDRYTSLRLDGYYGYSDARNVLRSDFRYTVWDERKPGNPYRAQIGHLTAYRNNSGAFFELDSIRCGIERWR